MPAKKPSLLELIEIAARHGFQSVTVRPYRFAEALRQGHTEAGLRRHLSDAGIVVSMIDGLNNGLSGIPSPDTLDPSTRKLMPPDVLPPADEATCWRAANALAANVLNVVAYRGHVVPMEDHLEQGVVVAVANAPD